MVLSVSHPYQLLPYLILTTLTSEQTGCALYIAQWFKLTDCRPKLTFFDSHKMLTIYWRGKRNFPGNKDTFL